MNNTLQFGTISLGECKRPCYKISTFCHDALAPAIAMVKYRRESGQPLPKINQAYDRKLNRCETVMYFDTAVSAYSMWDLLKFVGKKYGHTSYLYHYDWEYSRLTKLDELDFHPKPILED